MYNGACWEQDARGRAGSGGRRRGLALKFQARTGVWSRQSVSRSLETTRWAIICAYPVWESTF